MKIDEFRATDVAAQLIRTPSPSKGRSSPLLCSAALAAVLLVASNSWSQESASSPDAAAPNAATSAPVLAPSTTAPHGADSPNAATSPAGSASDPAAVEASDATEEHSVDLKTATASGGSSNLKFKKMSLDELMNVDVISVSRQPERLMGAASAIQVITGEDIHRSGATNLPQALRLAPNLRVAQVNSYGWVVSSRGFSGLFSNKLLVMIDGRTIYTPLFAGVSWDAQNVVLEDIDRIEVVSGPGGTLWGANAVNGVINIVTKSAKDTQGVYVTGAGGTYLDDLAAVRYGGAIGDNLHYRVYAQRADYDNTFHADGSENADEWGVTNGGFRMDYDPSEDNTFTLQGDLYGGTERTLPDDARIDGQNMLARWTHTISPDSQLKAQVYIDHTFRQDPSSTLSDTLLTYDMDIQHSFKLGDRHSLVWGFGYRRMLSDVEASTTFVGFVPNSRTMELFSAFIQDEIIVVPDRWRFTAGVKLEHNDFSGFEVQPSVRLAWTPTDRQTIWGAVSRAIRSPSRIDVDYQLPTYDVPLNTPNVDGGPDFDSEKLMAYELGYRIQPASRVSISLSTFYNRYDDLYGVEALPGTMTYRIQNPSEGESWGAELGTSIRLFDWLRLRGGYTYFYKSIWNKPGHTAPTASLGNDPKHQVLLQTIIDLPHHFQFDVTGRYVSALPDPEIAAYVTFDARLAWQHKNLELAVVGQNLGDSRHPEFGELEIPRSVYGKVTLRW
jgi:iron complex outermembrane receptor protein